VSNRQTAIIAVLLIFPHSLSDAVFNFIHSNIPGRNHRVFRYLTVPRLWLY